MSVHDVGTVDRVGLARDGTATLMIYCGGYMGQDYSVHDIAKKVETYLDFILEGQMVEHDSSLKDKPPVIRLSCQFWPNRDYAAAFKKMAEQIKAYDIGFVVEVSSMFGEGGIFNYESSP